MVDIFKEKMCNYCKNSQCNKEIIIYNNNNIIFYKCNEYIKDESKTIPYKSNVFITAKRKHINLYEI